MYRGSRLRSIWLNVITGSGMWKVCTEEIDCIAFEHERYHRFGHVLNMYRSSGLRIALWTRVKLQVWTCVKYVTRQSIAYSTLNTSYMTGLDMCKVCNEAVDCVALWARVTLQVWTCVKYVTRQSIAYSTLNTSYMTGLDMCKVCTEAVQSVALWTRVTLQVWTCLKYVPRQSIAWHFEHELHYRFGHV